MSAKDDTVETAVSNASGEARSNRSAWGRHGRMSIRTSHVLCPPLVWTTPEREEEEVSPGPAPESAPEFPIPESVVRARAPHRLPEDVICRSPIAGLVVKVTAAAGQRIQRRQTVLIIEAMKMQNQVSSEVDGTLKAIHVQPGDAVKAGAILFELD
jgi:biotin carboxyl carrier protein